MKVFPIKIGLEVHGYLDTREKLFCMCRTTKSPGVGGSGYGGMGDENVVNNRICPICTGTPGSKPMGVNLEAVRKMVAIVLVLKSKINFENLVWQRKHYDWADLPKGYQITMSGPHAVVNAVGGKFRGIEISEIHLEEDPAQWNPETGKVNYNRSGLPLVEIVTEPEFSDADGVVDWLKNLVLSLSYIKAVRKNAGIKVDVNVSTCGERVEMKNLNSIEKIRRAIEYEVARQKENCERGVEQKRETRMFDEKLGKTVVMREKESAQDYRFIPEPDLPVLEIEKKFIEEIQKSLPEMPEVKMERLLRKYRVDEENARILTRNLELVEFFEALAVVDATEVGRDGKRLGEAERVKRMLPWITVELLRVLNYNRKSLEDEDVDIRPSHLAELIGAVSSGKITKLKAKQIMNDFVPKSFSLKECSGDIGNISEEAVLNLCRQVVDENPKIVGEYKSGKSVSLNYLIGEVMRLSERRANFKQVIGILKKMI